MKQLLFGVAILLCGTATQAQMLNNNSNCEITATQICYDPNSFPPCKSTSGPSVIASGGGGSVALPPACPPPMETAYRVCWTDPACFGINPCVIIDANKPIGSCSGAPWSGNIMYCTDCAISGMAFVSFDPTTGDINVF